MTIDALLKQKRAKKNEMIAKRNALGGEFSDALHARGLKSGDVMPPDLADLRDRRIVWENAIDEIVREIKELERIQAEDENFARLANDVRESDAGRQHRATSRISVVEARTYHPGQADEVRSTGRGYSFLTDLYRSQILGDPTAGERLARHGEEVRAEQPAMYERAVNTGGVGAFVPPQYLVDLWAEYARAGRPVADLCNSSVPLPEQGMTVQIPRVTTASTTAVQASENASLSNTDLDETTLTVPVVTIAGYTDASRQAIERGALVEEMLFADLAADYNAKLDAQVVNGSGSSGQHLGILGVSGINTITYTDASPTIPEAWPKLADAVGRIISTRFTGPTAIVMRPNAWAWFMSATDTTGRPLVNAGNSGPYNALGTVSDTQYGSVVGSILGLPVIVSGNVPNNLGAGTNETRLIVADFRDLYLMEDSGGPVQLRFEQPLSSTLGIRLSVHGYSAFASGRQPTAISVVAGTGLIVPAL
ncbi:MAG: phage major capsid protein [Candidatus Nanopelagicales bacterium]